MAGALVSYVHDIPVLDHGYIRSVESWGSDESIIEAARMSTQKGFLGWGPKCETCGEDQNYPYACSKPTPGKELVATGRGGHMFRAPGDEKLLKYLYDNKHATPFEFAGLVIEVQAPIFVFREWHRHRTQSYNELSARYTPLPDVNYLPSVERCMMVSGASKQSHAVAGAQELTHRAVFDWLTSLDALYAHAQSVYQAGLDIGIPKELARLPVPVARYSRMRAHTCLRNWLAFMTLRSDKNPGAQWEIKQFANALGGILGDTFPRTMQLFNGTP